MTHCNKVFLLVLVLVSGCRLEPEELPLDPDFELKDPLTPANFGLLGVRFYESSNNLRRWNIEADFAELHRTENYVFLKRVAADFQAGRTGNVVHTVSDEGRSALNRNAVDLQGNVKVRSHSGYVFTMSSLRYDGDHHEFSSNDEVWMKGPHVDRPQMILRGTGLKADIDQEHFFLHRRVTAHKKLKGGDWLLIKSERGEFYTEEGRAVFNDSIETKLPPGLVIQSDYMELVSTKDRELMEARENVRVQFKDKRGWAEKAYFSAGGDRIILEGTAKVENKRNEVRGRKIVLYTTDDRVEVTEAEGRVRN